MDFKKTPLFEEHQKLGAKLAGFGGWLMPIQYSGIISEHNWTRQKASLFDICHMGEFIIKGEADKSNFSNLTTINLNTMPLFSCRYGFMLNESGGVIDDLVVYKIKPDEWMVVVNAATIDSDVNHISSHLSKDSEFKNISSNLAKLDLQGPDSGRVLEELIGSEINKLKYYTFDYFTIEGEKNIISRTGYTGERGYELYISPEKVKSLWNNLLGMDTVKPAGLGARDTLRLEMGYPLYGQDITEQVNPLEAGFGKFIDFNKDFIGKEALLKKKKEGLTKKLACFITDSRRAARHNFKIFSNNKEAGIVTSGSFSPSLSCSIGMGYIETGLKTGDEIIIKENDQSAQINARLTTKPFYKNGTARKIG
ncbi:MAG: glycine cleavage system aminomethyltransferase GcvT [Candidatus Omnitrophota bacterium]